MSEQHSDSSLPPTTSSPGGETPASAAMELDHAAPTQAAPVDMTKYKTDELRQRFQQLFGVVHLLPWAAFGLGGCMAISFLMWTALFLPRAAPFVAVVTLMYMGLQGFFLGTFAASLLVITRVFQQLTAIVDITLQTLRQAFSDMKDLGDPKRRAELAGALIHGAVIPAVQSVIAVKVGLLRLPISFVVNRLLSKSAKKLTKSIETKALKADDDATTAPLIEISSPPQSTPADTASAPPSHLDRMQDRIEIIARRTRRATLIPAVFLFVLATMVTSIPWIVVLVLVI